MSGNVSATISSVPSVHPSAVTSTSFGAGRSCIITSHVRCKSVARSRVVIITDTVISLVGRDPVYPPRAGRKAADGLARSWSGQKLFDGGRVLGRLNPTVAIGSQQFTRC